MISVGRYCQAPSQFSNIQNSNPSMTQSLSLKVRILPILILLTYLNITVVLFAYGPWKYPVTNDLSLYLFLIFSHFALLIGYSSAVLRSSQRSLQKYDIGKLLLASTLVNLLLFFPTLYYRTGSIIPTLNGIFSNLGDAYYQARILKQENTPYIEYVRFLFGPFLFILLPFTVFYWNQLKFNIRVLAVIAIICDLSISISMGVNRGIILPITIFIFSFLAKRFSRENSLGFSKQIHIIFLCVIAFAVFFAFFSSSILSRTSGYNSFYYSGIGIYADTNNIMLRALPPQIQASAAALINYLSQGYYALSLSLQLPYESMFGVGHSMFVTRLAVRITDFQEFSYRSYPDRIMSIYGWDSYGGYTTIYPWIASDISFPGTVVVMFFIGRLFAISWLDSLQHKNPFAIAMFAQFTVMLVTFPTVNWVVNSAEGFSSFWGVLCMWFLFRKNSHYNSTY